MQAWIRYSYWQILLLAVGPRQENWRPAQLNLGGQVDRMGLRCQPFTARGTAPLAMVSEENNLISWCPNQLSDGHHAQIYQLPHPSGHLLCVERSVFMANSCNR